MKSNIQKRRRSQITFTEPSLTRQECATECNINHIMKKFERNAVIEHINNRPPMYGDFSQVNTYQEALNKINEAEMLFSELPAEVRKRFSNDPVVFVEAASDPANASLMVLLGLADEKILKTETQKQNQQALNPENPSTPKNEVIKPEKKGTQINDDKTTTN